MIALRALTIRDQPAKYHICIHFHFLTYDMLDAGMIEADLVSPSQLAAFSKHTVLYRYQVIDALTSHDVCV